MIDANEHVNPRAEAFFDKRTIVVDIMINAGTSAKVIDTRKGFVGNN